MSPSTQSTSALECSLGCLSRSDGSSSFALNGTTKVLCSVYGPGEVKLMKELSNRAAILITYKPRVGQPTNKVCMYLNGISDLNWFGHVLTLPVCVLAWCWIFLHSLHIVVRNTKTVHQVNLDQINFNQQKNKIKS